MSSRVTCTATGFPSFVPGSNTRCRAVFTASASRPYPASSERIPGVWRSRYHGGVDFVGVLDRVDAFLTERGWRFAVAGGVALAVYGNPRLTLDLDVVTEAAAQDALVTWMEGAGYVTLYLSLIHI